MPSKCRGGILNYLHLTVAFPGVNEACGGGGESAALLNSLMCCLSTLIKMGTPVVSVMKTLYLLPCIPLAFHFILALMQFFSHVQPPKSGRFNFHRSLMFSIHATLDLRLTTVTTLDPTAGHSGRPPGSLQPQPWGCFWPYQQN